jgi:signal transduction histidine kinase
MAMHAPVAAQTGDTQTSVSRQGSPTPVAWVFFLAAGLLSVACYFLVLKTENQHNVAETAINLVSAVAIAVGIRRNKPTNRLGWYFILAGFFIFGAANIPSTYYSWHTGQQPFPSIADAGYLMTEPLICIGLLLFIRQRRGLQLGGRLLDAATVSVAIGYPIFIFLVEPNLRARGIPLFSRLVSAAYPTADLALMAVALVFVLGPGRKSLAYRLLIAAFLGLFASDLAFSGATLAGWFTAGSIINLGWPLFSILGASAALHPSMRTIEQPAAAQQRLSVWRILLVSAAAFILTPVVHAIQIARAKGDTSDLLVVSGLLFVLITTRLYLFMRDDRAQQASLELMVGELKELQHQRQELLKRTVQSAEHDRRWLAAELHDGPIQRLSALPLSLEHAKQTLGEDSAIGGTLDRTQKALAQEIRGLRGLMGDLRPPALDESGLAAALLDHASSVCRDNAIVLETDVDPAQDLPPEIETVLFRVAQEALTNVVRHAHATRVRITLTARDSHLRLVIADNGKGFDAMFASSSSRDHFGLVSMRERMEMSGGTWELRTGPGSGTVIDVSIPFAEQGAA